MNRQSFLWTNRPSTLWIAGFTLALVFTGAARSQQSGKAPPPAIHTVTTTGGTTNTLAKYSGTSSIVNSALFEQGGKVGIGTTSPSSTLTVNGSLASSGIIQSTIGGFKFPDGTTQSTAANGGLASVSHFGTLTGNGTLASPLGISLPLGLFGNSPGDLVQVGNSGTGYGLTANSIATTGGGLYGYSTGSFNVNGLGVGVYGDSLNGTGIFGHSFHWVGVLGYTDTDGAWATEGYIVKGTNNATAVFGRNDSGSGNGWAGFFSGDVDVTGNLTKSGSFKIDHPLDPANKYLYHSFVESPDMKNIYDGTTFTDRNGFAVVTMPEYFSALNRDFRYQVTVIGQSAYAFIASELENNQFTIRTDKPSVKVSWQVTGIRQDVWANAHRIPTEVKKPAQEAGSYLHPELFNEVPEKSLEWARWPNQMQNLSDPAHPKSR